MLRHQPPHLFAALILGSFVAATSPTTSLAQAQPPRVQPDKARESQRDDRPLAERIRERRDRFAEERGLSQEQLEHQYAQVLAVLQDIDPVLADRLRNAEDARPGVQIMILERRFPEVLRLARLREHDQALYALRVRELVLYRQMQSIAQQIRLAQNQIDAGRESDVDVDDLKRDLERLAKDHFEADQDAKELELQRFERKLEEMRDRHRQRGREQRQIVESTVDELLTGQGRRPDDRGPDFDQDGPGRGPGFGQPRGPRGSEERGERERSRGSDGPPQDQLDL